MDEVTQRLSSIASRLPALCWTCVALFISQEAQGQSVLTGTVIERRTNTPLAGVDVIIAQLALKTRTDAKGRFLLDDIGAGHHAVLVRRLGFDSASAIIAFSGADEITRDFQLIQLAQPLPEVPVKGAAVPLTAKLREFERRREFGIGRFLTATDLEKKQNRRLGDVLSSIPGAAIAHGAGLSGYVFSSRGVNTIENQPAFQVPSGQLRGGTSCPVAVSLDGVWLYRGTTRMQVQMVGGRRVVTRPDGAEPLFDINSVQTSEVAAIEFYAGPAQMPPELNATGNACGALLIWTK